MLTWVLASSCLGLLALGFMALNESAPHRVRFLAAFLAACAWLVPWPLLPALAAQGVGLELWQMERVIDVQASLYTGLPLLIVQGGDMPLAPDAFVLGALDAAVAALCLVGLALFIRTAVEQHRELGRLARAGSDGTGLWQAAGLAPLVPITIQREIGGAFSSGLWRPRIWVHADLCASAELPTVLRHELTHIRQHDNWYLLALTFAEKLFWWNPLVRLLGRRARELQELSCDEKCRGLMPDYPERLARLMLDTARAGSPRRLALSANMFDQPHPNVRRIQLLQRSYAMKTRHILSAIATGIAAVLTVGLVTAQPAPGPEAGRRVVIVKRQADGSADAQLPGSGVAVAGSDEDLVFFTEALPAGELPPPGAAPVRLLRAGLAGSAEAPDQYLMINGDGDDLRVSFRFTDAPLPMVLGPLADMGAGALPPPPAPGAADVMFARPVQRGVAFVGEPARATIAAPGAGMPVSPNLLLNDASAGARRVSVSGSNLTLEEAVDLVAAEAGCAIELDGDALVVSRCAD